MAGELTLSVAPLVDLCGVLGIEVSDLAAVEDADVLSYTFQITSANAAHLDAQHVREFVAHYGPAAKITLRSGELEELPVAPGITDEQVSRFAESAARSAARSGGPDNAVINVDKAKLAERLAPPSPGRAIRVFLFAEALRRELARGITRFEAKVWNEAPAPLVIAVLDADINLAGTHLTIVGASSLPAASAAASVPPPAQDFAAITTSRDQQIGWDMQWVRALTPWHFALTGTCDDLELIGLLRAQLAKLAVLFTCDRARSRPEQASHREILAEYRGRDHIAVIPIDERMPLACSEPEISAVLRTVTWCYERHGDDGQPDWVSDRLPFIQTRVAQSLEPQPARERFTAFVRVMPDMFDGIQWQWKAFIEGKVSEYLDRVQQIETIVSDTVASFTDRATSLVTALTQTILAAVAVLIGSFIAAAFHSPFNTALFRIGVLTYAIYVVLFPGAVGLISSASSLRRARREFDTRIGRFRQTLYTEKVTEIVGTRVSAAQRYYYRWLAFVVVVYIIIAIAAGIAAAEVPHLALHIDATHH